MPTRRPSSATVSEARSAAASSGFPHVRMRRNRRTHWSRRLVAENRLSVDDLIWPLFVVEGKATRVPVASMPGVERALRGPDRRGRASRPPTLGIPAMALFPYTDPKLRDRRRLAKPSIRTTSSAARRAPSSEAGARRSASSLRRGARSLHQPRQTASCTAARSSTTRRSMPWSSRPGAGRGRLRHPRAVRHDGRPHRRHPRGPRSGRPSQHADHGLRRQVRARLLRAVPRRGRLGDRRSRATSAPTRWIPPTPTRRCARWRSTSPRAPTW